MKYISAEKMIAEIERELSAHDKVDHLEAHEVGKAWNRGHRRALENILDFISSLQQDQPSLPSNLDEAARDYALSPEDVAKIFNKVRELQVKYPATGACFEEVAEWFNNLKEENK